MSERKEDDSRQHQHDFSLMSANQNISTAKMHIYISVLAVTCRSCHTEYPFHLCDSHRYGSQVHHTTQCGAPFIKSIPTIITVPDMKCTPKLYIVIITWIYHS